MNIMTIAFLLGIVGLFFGSFAGATVWRLRAKQLEEDEAAGEKINVKEKKEIKKLQKSSVLKDRSVCLHCGHQLQWYDLVPIVSWLTLRGKCRYCHRRIGYTEPIIELAMAAFFAVSFLMWPAPLTTFFEVARFVLWLGAGVGFGILIIYDLKWFLLPNKVVFPLLGLAALSSLTVLIESSFSLDTVTSIVGACLILSGIYYAIYELSRHAWIGFGDVKLGLVLALLLSDWKLATLALFLANAVGTLMVLPFMLSGRLSRQARIPFGPLMIVGWLLAGLYGDHILRWYLSLSMGVS